MQQVCNIFLQFLAYSFLGWTCETIYCSIGQGKFVNRGFLNGPLCPVYGFGAMAVLVFLRFIPLNLWISALASGVHVSIFTLMGMRIRRVPPAKIVGPLIKAEKAGLNMQISKMEAHFLAGGNLDRVITALITARGAGVAVEFGLRIVAEMISPERAETMKAAMQCR